MPFFKRTSEEPHRFVHAGVTHTMLEGMVTPDIPKEALGAEVDNYEMIHAGNEPAPEAPDAGGGESAPESEGEEEPPIEPVAPDAEAQPGEPEPVTAHAEAAVMPVGEDAAPGGHEAPPAASGDLFGPPSNIEKRTRMDAQPVHELAIVERAPGEWWIVQPESDTFLNDAPLTFEEAQRQLMELQKMPDDRRSDNA